MVFFAVFQSWEQKLEFRIGHIKHLSVLSEYPKAAVPNLSGTGTSFMEDSFSTDGGGGGMVSGSFKCITFIMHSISIIGLPRWH